tara:strand:+ start:284 stop:997 length:714 start_codon:yes stop_codon:yes gene_type:complete
MNEDTKQPTGTEFALKNRTMKALDKRVKPDDSEATAWVDKKKDEKEVNEIDTDGDIMKARRAARNHERSIGAKPGTNASAEIGGKVYDTSIGEGNMNLVREYLEGYFGDNLAEGSVNEEDIHNAFTTLFDTAESLYSYVHDDEVSEETYAVVGDFLTNYFNDTIVEDISEEDISNAIQHVFDTTDAASESLLEATDKPLSPARARRKAEIMGKKETSPQMRAFNKSQSSGSHISGMK